MTEASKESLEKAINVCQYIWENMGADGAENRNLMVEKVAQALDKAVRVEREANMKAICWHCDNGWGDYEDGYHVKQLCEPPINPARVRCQAQAIRQRSGRGE